MAKHVIYIDGSSGTTGLQIQDRLKKEEGIELIILPEEQRKSLPRRLEAMGRSELSILCLPDEAAREIVSAAPADTRIIDASTAHRTSPDWVYGFPELKLAGGGPYRDLIRNARRVAVPGCHATGFLALAAPLVQGGLLPPSARLHCHSLTGYSGGGKTLIAAYEDPRRPVEYASPRQYGLDLRHKHLPEMGAIAGLERPPLFCPIVDDFYQGMLVSITLGQEDLAGPCQAPSPGGLAGRLLRFFKDFYRDEGLIHVMEREAPDGTLAAGALAGRDDLELWISGQGEQALLMARFDNLGKGASGAAVQCLNIMLGRPETAGLKLAQPGENH
jgi:N-acetyl-gamma-glutamyl-phosphate reductase